MVHKTGMFNMRYNIKPGVPFGSKVNYSNVKFGQMTLDRGIYAQTTQRSSGSVNTSDVEKKYGTNIYNYLNNTMPAVQAAVNTITTPELESNAGVAANTAKTSQEVLASVQNASTYGELSAAKTELEVGKDNLASSYNNEVSTYVDQNVQAVLSELGIKMPALSTISGEYDDYSDDMEKFDNDKNTCQASQDECNQKLPEVSQKKCEAKSRVDALSTSASNLKEQIKAAKAGKFDTSALEAKLAKVEAELSKANADLAEYESQENALNEAILQLENKKVSIEKNKKDLKNYHEAESMVVDKTYQIAKEDDQKLNEQIQKLKNKQREIKRASTDTNSTTTNGGDNIRNQRLERLQKEYEKIALDASDIFVDLDLLVQDNDGSKNVKNSLGQVYNVAHYDDAKKILVDGETDI